MNLSLKRNSFVVLEKHKNEFLVNSFGECCGSTVLTAACYWPSRHWIPDMTFVSVPAELKPFTLGVSLLQECVLSPLLFIVYTHWIDCHSRVDVGVTVGSCRINRLLCGRFDTVSISSTGPSTCTSLVFSCVRPIWNENQH